MFYAAIFHSFGTYGCLLPDCHTKYHPNVFRLPVNASKELAWSFAMALPISGQVLGILYVYSCILERRERCEHKHRFCKIEDTCALVRSIFALLGLGIIYFILDVIAVIGKAIRECFDKRNSKDQI